MKLELGPLRRSYVAPNFTGEPDAKSQELTDRVRRPIVVGSAVIGAMVLGLGLWAGITPLSSGVSAPGQVRVESNRKTIRRREGGVVKAILVREGDRVRPGQPLLVFDEVQARAGFDVMRNQADSALAQSARYQAEATGRPSIVFPADLNARMNDPRVASMVRDQQFLFTSRLQLFNSQLSVLKQRVQQLETNVEGLQAQVDSVDEQARLTREELAGYQTLFEKGYAPKTLILRYQRALADLGGRKGQLISDISKTREQMGEARIQMSALRNQRQTEAADGMREMQSRLADALPRLSATQQTLSETTVRSPVDGYVLNLSQFTVGGVAGAGEVLMDVVPADTPLVVTAMVRPQDVENVRPGMSARVQLQGVSRRWVSPLPAKVVTVSADRLVNDKTGEGYFRADLRIDPKDIAKLAEGVKMTPGMPADTMIVTGERTVLGFLLSPITDTLSHAFREQ
ncbi:MAG: HlyD family type I secretion periplasmic adaptor subunit [Phenylobacterium sp.]|uniref:HlyD family type I secretion periplasmic adaptor subunit n=1 Tax=Phenylobacterium sp. TaxID=1871053 RepID=UPI00273549F2|nr:HlyD family type I secretion periplasmic adaptor subunit [Phenylobacterium sp.]MDP3175330.1 HlyD family type I secretion periplasmic adaptor subunit [Phenylobacterium sp.]